ncbi:hypothetical protein [Sunxiuqinia elliptica]|uniref:SD-repeat containing protein B domain-containing protein n=1 Tax=Sunxiuqinia elliptica TaxID=655355 RepID=A0A4R6H6Z0_9BACT|nr:hypothetical protein [Sunxiuqinia elliptica]TDO03980.1 hypothetical protein DET52_102318 [Sunxiuqinia elliptica]TDO62262.1 hypothetical protein DET65_1995 [Sunxiuqinia elliptica]
MKNNVQILIFLMTISFGAFISCDKDDEGLSQSNTIEGQLIANENMTEADFGELSVNLLKLPDGTDLESITSDTDLGKLIKTIAVNIDGSFAFENLENGNYIIALNEGFSFVNNSFVVVSLTDGMTVKVSKSVDRVPDDNPRVA